MRLCPKGHDKDVVGVYSDGSCAECGRERARRRRAEFPDAAEAAAVRYEVSGKRKRPSDRARKKKATDAARYRRLRLAALLHYGDGSCAKCGHRPADPLDLHLDHVTGGGTDHRRVVTGGRSATGFVFYTYLRDAGYPATPPLQTLCEPCHKAKHAQR